jgi:hypothetical protein
VVDSSSCGAEDEITVRNLTIPDFLAKPYLVSQFTLSTATTANTIVSTQPVATMLNANPQWTNKVAGFNLLRGKVCFKLMANANPFQQFKLLVHFLPCLTQLAGNDACHAGMHNFDLTCKTTQPHVEYDARDSTCELHIPYVAPTNFFNVKSKSYDWGTFYVSVLSPLLTGALGETTVDISLYCWFEDVELAAPIVPQSSMRPKKGYKSKANLAREEHTEMGPVEDTLSKVAIVGGLLSSVPALAPFTAPVAFASAIGAGIASVFGWAKPVSTLAPGIMSKQMQRYAATSDGVDTSLPLGLFHNDHLRVTDCCALTGSDEMNFTHLKTIPALTRAVTWTTSNVSGASVYTQLVGPIQVAAVLPVTKTMHSYNVNTGPPVSYLARSFGYYRGSMKVKIKFVKTIFHSGRLQVTWTPYTNVTTTPTLTTSITALREIIDIRETNEVELTLPYYLGSNYLPTASSMGQLDIQVLNELRCPETCSSTMYILLYYSAGPDFELQAPASTTTQPFWPQSGEVAASGVVGGDPSHDLSAKYSQLSLGEHFTSIRQLLLRYTCIPSNTALTVPAGGQDIYFWPWACGVITTNTVTGVVTAPPVGGDTYSNLAPLFAFFRGGMRVMIGTVPPSTTAPDGPTVLAFTDMMPQTTFLIQGVTSNATSSPYGGSGWGTPGSNMFTAHGMACIEDLSSGYVQVPYYSPTHTSLSAVSSGSSAVPTDGSQPQNVLKFFSPSNPTTFSANVVLQRAVADDFQFSYFLGTVPWISNYV